MADGDKTQNYHLLIPVDRAGRSTRPGECLRVRFRLTTNSSLSSYGLGVLLDNGGVPLGGAVFRRLRDAVGARLVGPDPAAACGAMGVPAGEPGVEAPDERGG